MTPVIGVVVGLGALLSKSSCVCMSSDVRVVVLWVPAVSAKTSHPWGSMVGLMVPHGGCEWAGEMVWPVVLSVAHL